MPDAPDYKMFLKLLNLTTSEFDGEALSAIRMANSVLARTNQTWEDLLKGKIVMIGAIENEPPGRKPTSPIYKDPVEINAYFSRLYSPGRNLGTFREWVDSVHEWWETKGFLTEAQYRTLKKSALR